MAWNYSREESTFKPIPVGAHRIRINSVEKKVSSTGKDMLSFKFDVSGYSSMIFHNIVFLPERPEITNRSLTQFFDAFPGIPDGDFHLPNWIGKVGAAQIKHEEYNGNTNAKIHYFIREDKQDGLPAWKEPERKSEDNSGQSVQTDADGFIMVDNGGDGVDGLF